MYQVGKEPMKKQQSVRFDPEVTEWLMEQAKKQKRSVSDIIRFIVDDAIASKKWDEMPTWGRR